MSLLKKFGKTSPKEDSKDSSPKSLAVAYGISKQARKRTGGVSRASLSEQAEGGSESMVSRLMKRRKMADGGIVQEMNTGMDPREDDDLPVDKNLRMAEGGEVPDLEDLLSDDLDAEDLGKENYDDVELTDVTGSDDSEEADEDTSGMSRAAIIRKRMLAKKDR